MPESYVLDRYVNWNLKIIDVPEGETFSLEAKEYWKYMHLFIEKNANRVIEERELVNITSQYFFIGSLQKELEKKGIISKEDSNSFKEIVANYIRDKHIDEITKPWENMNYLYALNFDSENRENNRYIYLPMTKESGNLEGNIGKVTYWMLCNLNDNVRQSIKLSIRSKDSLILSVLFDKENILAVQNIFSVFHKKRKGEVKYLVRKVSPKKLAPHEHAENNRKRHNEMDEIKIGEIYKYGVCKEKITKIWEQKQIKLTKTN